MLRCLASTFQFQLDEAGSALLQSVQKPSTWRDNIILGETTMLSPLTLFLLEAPALYRAMLKPNPGTVLPPKLTDFVEKKRSAKSSRSPNAAAHQASDVPHPSHVPQLVAGLTVVVVSAAPLPHIFAATSSDNKQRRDMAAVVGIMPVVVGSPYVETAVRRAQGAGCRAAYVGDRLRHNP